MAQAYGEFRQLISQSQINCRMIILPILATAPMFAAIGYSLVYLLAGGGLGGAILIFIVAKMFGK